MRILVTGGTGMLGHKLVQQLSPDFEVSFTIRGSVDRPSRYGIFRREQIMPDVDLLSDVDLRRAVETTRPDVIINAAGVIKQLPSSKDVVNTLMVNAILPHRLYSLSAEFGFRLISISTDCVFSGEKGSYTEADPADALDLYGRSKNLGEVSGERCLTLRTSIVGRELETSHGLVEWFLGNRGGKVKGFTRAIYSGFPTIVFADIIAHLLIECPDLDGLYHVSSEPIDKSSLLQLINKAYEANVDVEPDPDFVIDRSLDSAKFRLASGFVPPTWDEMIDRMATDPTPYDQWRK